MKVSFDGMRRNIARSYNEMAIKLKDIPLDENQKEAIEQLRSNIGGLLCVYDDEVPDCNDLSEMVELVSIDGKEQENNSD